MLRLKTVLRNIIVSRTDSIGDVVLSLPVAKALKERFPDAKVVLLGREYTRSVAEDCVYIDAFLELQEFLEKPVRIAGEAPDCIVHVLPNRQVAVRAKALGIPVRIGTTNRLFHWYTCNKLVRLSRKNSPLHEAQLNMKLLAPLGIPGPFSLDALGRWYGLQPKTALPAAVASLAGPGKYNLILHPRSRGSAREWGLPNFAQLIRSLDPEKYRIFISGTLEERKSLDALFQEVGELVTDLTGKLTLQELIAFISRCDGLVACSTGPIHLAAALNKDALGIYAPLHSIHPGRWKPVGPKARVFVVNRQCSDCRKMKAPCHCIEEVSWRSVRDELDKRSALLK